MAGLASVATFGLRFVAQNQASAVMKGLARDFGVFNRITGRGFEELGHTIKEGGLRSKIAMGTAGLVGFQLVQGLTQASNAAVGALRSVIKEAADFEEQMVSFSVIAGASSEDLGRLKQRILEVTGPLPTTANQVAKAATAFARMSFAANSSTENLIQLSKQAIMFGRAIGVTDEQAALYMGKLATWLNLQDKNAKSMGNIASVVTRLGWRVKGTSQDIIKATERFGAFTRAMGASEVQTLSLAGLVVDSGILIRRGSTAINRSFQLMATNTQQFGQAMVKMGQVGAAVDFERMFQTDPVKAFETVLRALSTQNGQYGATLLKSLGLHGNYISDLITMSRNVDKLNDLQAEGTDELAKARKGVGATQKAFDEYSKTMNASIEILKGAWDNLKIVIGSPLLGALSGIFRAFADLLTVMIAHVPGLLEVVGVLLAVATAGLFLLKVYTSIKLMMAALRLAGMATAAAWIKGFLIFVAVLVAIVALATFILWLYRKIKGESKGLAETLDEVTGGIKDVSGQVVEAAGGGLVPGEAEQREATIQARGSEQLAESIGALKIPGAQHGGVFVKPTPVVIGEAGPEVAMSTEDFAGMMENLFGGFMEKIEALAGGGTSRIEMNNPVYLDGTLIAQNVSESEELDGLRRGEIG